MRRKMDAAIIYRPLNAGPFKVTLPGSKSVAARMLILNHIYGNCCKFENLPDCDDTRELAQALNRLCLNGGGERRYDLGSGGTSLRFFLAYVASIEGFEGVVDSSESLRKRPLAPLVDALKKAGADIEYIGDEGSAPLLVKGRKLHGFDGQVGEQVSSQFVSALMMASILWENRYFPKNLSNAVSRPYIEMTSKIIDEFEKIAVSQKALIKCEQKTNKNNYIIKKIDYDWSAASYFYELVLLNPDIEIILEGLGDFKDSLQGDRVCSKLFDEIGVNSFLQGKNVILRGDRDRIDSWVNSKDTFFADLCDAPDLAPALVVGLCLAGIRFRLRGLMHLRHKESDRIAALISEMGKAGYVLDYEAGALFWNGKMTERNSEINFYSHRDHRIAMSLAMSAVTLGQISIKESDCVSKSFPHFFDILASLGFLITKS